jgi:hypothetical protein
LCFALIRRRFSGKRILQLGAEHDRLRLGAAIREYNVGSRGVGAALQTALAPLASHLIPLFPEVLLDLFHFPDGLILHLNKNARALA